MNPTVVGALSPDMTIVGGTFTLLVIIGGAVNLMRSSQLMDQATDILESMGE